jgi:hypothetical protein
MDTFRGGAAPGATVEEGYRRRILGLDPGALMTILIVLVIIILLLMLFNMSSDSNASSPGKGDTRTQGVFFNPLNNTMRNNAIRTNPPVVTTATTTRAL